MRSVAAQPFARKVLAVLVLALTSLLVAGAPKGLSLTPQKVYKVRYAHIPGGQLLQDFVGRDQNIYRQVGLDIQFITFTSGPAIFAALQHGDVDVANMSSIAFMVGKAQGVPGKAFAVIFDISGTNRLIAQGASGIKTAKDLKGKKVAAVTGASGYYGLAKYLTDAGMTFADIQHLAMPAPAILPAFLTKDVDAAWVWTPWYNKMITAGGVPVTSNRDVGALTVQVWVGTPDWLSKNPEAAVRLLEANERILRILVTQYSKVVLPLMAKEMDLPVEETNEVLMRTVYVTNEQMAAKNSPYSLHLSGYQDGSAGLAKIFKNTADFLNTYQLTQNPATWQDSVDRQPLMTWMRTHKK